MTPSVLRWQHLGRVPYGPILSLQKSLWAEVRDGAAPPALLTLEHEPVITLGKRANAADVRIPEESLAARGIELFRTERGGQATYHGPGQLVLYAIVDVRRRQIGVGDLVRTLAGSIARELEEYGVHATYDTEHPGLWTDGAKIAAVGMRVKQGTSYHGAALNVTTALDAFELIVPCGMPEARTTRLADFVTEPPPIEALAGAVAGRFAARLKLEFVRDELQKDRPSVGDAIDEGPEKR